jgi:adenylylsulfate kinase
MTAWTLWITGLPGSGKSTIAYALQSTLKIKGIHTQILSTDDLRKVMTPKPTYSGEEREKIYATIVFIAKLLNQNGINTIIDATGNLRLYRALARNTLKPFAIAYAKCSLNVCIRREEERGETFGAPTEIYKKGKDGRSITVPGLNVPYEEPRNADIVVDTEKLIIAECVEKIYNFIITSPEFRPIN